MGHPLWCKLLGSLTLAALVAVGTGARAETDVLDSVHVESLARVIGNPEATRYLVERLRAGAVAVDAEILSRLEAVLQAPGETASPDALDYFETHVRPVLAEHCIECHGPERQKMGLRLDRRAGMLQGGESGPALVPGDALASRLMQVLRYDGEVKMPPTGKLDDEKIAAIEAWITMGAPWPSDDAPVAAVGQSFDEKVAEARAEHWAFQPVKEPNLPELDDAWVQSPIDQFVLARLREASLAPSVKADKRTLIRRATFDLLGLPPTPGEVDAFLADESPEAFERVVDRLLASPHYGERWARYWLDIARYSDTKGYVFQEERAFPFSHTYRDYVIHAFNEDLPYDRFLMHQLAADKMDFGGDKRPLAAMGYLTLGRRFIGNIHDITDDRIDVVTRGMMGLTVSCARCHDHKFDPISAADYYALYGVFRSSEQPEELPLLEEPDPENPLYQKFVAELTSAEGEVSRYVQELHIGILSHTRENTTEYLLAAHDAQQAVDSEALQTLARDRGLRWQLVERWRDYLKAKSAAPDAIWGPWAAFAVLSQEEFPTLAPELARQFFEHVYADQPINAKIAAAFEGASPTSMEEVAQRYGRALDDAARQWAELLASYSQIATRVEGAAPTRPTALPDPDAEAVRQVLYGLDSPSNVPSSDVEMLSDVPTRDQVRNRRNAVLRIKATHPGRPDRAMALTDAATLFDPYVFLRGDPAKTGDKVPRRFLQVLDPACTPFAQGSGRLELAKAIASARNPLTARVFVNRVWMYHFGRPLVETTSDFGVRSEPPSHPELLDYLAWRFVQDGWSIKRLHRMIMLSSAYQQSSDDREDAVGVDPVNRLVWRQNRQRLDLESMRDAMLVAAGTLDTAMYGPSVDITQRPFPSRRSVYSYIERQNLPGMFRTFDFASPDAHSPKRYSTTVPQQALFMLNGPFAVEQARVVARRVEGELAERVHRLHEIVYQRPASEDEVVLAQEFVSRAAEAAPLDPPAPPEWEYGYGSVDPEANAVTSFTALPHWTGEAWQGGPALPDAGLGWVTLSARGGHPGGDAAHSAIRRWVSPVDGVIAIDGELKHNAEPGDGVSGYVVSSRAGIVWSGTAFNTSVESNVEAIAVAVGDTIDLAVACGQDESHDSFSWHPRIMLIERSGASTGPTQWLAKVDFAGPMPEPPAPLDPWEQYAQVLLMTNEFLFVD